MYMYKESLRPILDNTLSLTCFDDIVKINIAIVIGAVVRYKSPLQKPKARGLIIYSQADNTVDTKKTM